MRGRFVIAALVALLLAPAVAMAAERVEMLVFFSRTCPHCEEARPVVEALAGRRPWLDVRWLEVSDPANAARYEAEAARMGQVAAYVPAFLFCGEMHVGYSRSTGMTLASRLDACHAGGAGSTPEPLALPWLGPVDAAALSLPLLTVVLAAADSFNPCAFFVLLSLLSLMVNARGRTRMAMVGGTFVAVSGLAYFAFMTAWLTLFLVASALPWVTAAAGLLALAIGLLDLKDAIVPALGGASLSIPKAARAGLFERMRGLVAARSGWAALAGTVVLAVVANAYELLCTAGFPMVYTRLLTLRLGPDGPHWVWLAFYNLVYVLPLAAIVAAFVVTLGRRKLAEGEGRALKAGAGTMMAAMGALLLVAPDRLQDPLTAAALLAVAAVAAGVVKVRA